MPRGGARSGAGRKRSGSNLINTEARKKAAETGDLPLDFLLAVMRDVEKDFPMRLDAAKAAAPYVHAKLASIDNKHSGKVDSDVTFQTIYESRPG